MLTRFLSLRDTVSLASMPWVKLKPMVGDLIALLSPRLRRRCIKLLDDFFEVLVSEDVEPPNDELGRMGSDTVGAERDQFSRNCC